MHSRREWLRRLSLATGGAVAVACGGPAEPSAQPQPTPSRRAAPYTVRLASWGPDELGRLLRLIAEDVRRQALDVRLEVEHEPVPPDDAWRAHVRLSAAIADGTVADLVQHGGTDWQQYAARGSLLPLGELASRDKWTLPWTDDEAYDAQSRFRGKRYLATFSAEPLVLFWRRDHFAQAGLAAPRADWSYLEFQDVAQRLTRVVDGRPRFGYDWSAGYVANLAWWRMNGAYEWDRLAEPRQALWTSPAVVEAIQYQLYDSQHTLRIAPTSAMKRADPALGIERGDVSMTVGALDLLPRLAGRPVDVQLLPTGKTRRKVHVVGLQGQVMTRNSKDRDAAWEALKWLTSENAQWRVAEAGRLCSVPELSRRFWLPMARARYGLPNAEAFPRALEGATTGLTGEVTEHVLDRDAGLHAALADVRDGRATAKQALERLQPRLQRLLDSYWAAERAR